VIGHGFDGVREQRLDAYAARFAGAGLAALVFDYRHFGSSEGEPRQLVDNTSQLEDWRAAIARARELDQVDPERIALWGTSTSGGHVVQLAAEDSQIAAVIAQVPLADGIAQLRSTPIGQTLRLLWAALKDRTGAAFGRAPFMVPAVGRPGALAAVTSPDALTGLDRITPAETTFVNAVAARFALGTAFYRPGRRARDVRCPLLVCMADGDRVIPSKPALAMVEAAERGELRRYPCGHYAMYVGDGFERAVRDQTAFLCRALGAAHVGGSPA
jgi:dienelactone hydrolase